MDKATFELAIERFSDAPPEMVWRVWTERLEEWWASKPWTTRVIANDMRPNGRMDGRMALVLGGPDGAASEMEGVYTEVIPNKSIVFTNAFTAGWIPQAPFMVGFFAFSPEGKGTRYRAGARHCDEAAHQRHEAMGFTQGWTIVADQLASLAERR